MPSNHSAAGSALVTSDHYSLVPTNPAVVTVSSALHWKPETTIARVQRALPSKFEQQVFLAVAGDFHIHPESMAALLNIYRGATPLTIRDLARRDLGNNRQDNPFGDFSDFLSACLHLVKIISEEYRGFTLTMELAGQLVLAYGTDQPEALIEMIDVNLDDVCDFFNVSCQMSYSHRMRTCVWLYVNRLLPKLRARGLPDIFNPSDLDAIHSNQRRYMEDQLDNSYCREDAEIEQAYDLLEGKIDL